MTGPRTIRVGVAVIALAALLGVGGMAARPVLFPGPPRAEVEVNTREVRSAAGRGQALATFRVVNSGGRDLVFGKTRASCGCSVVSVEPRVVNPGAEGIVTVRATPSSVGRRSVSIGVATNDPKHPELTFAITLIGTRDMPYVAAGSETLSFGPLRRGESAEEVVWFSTREQRGSEPWLASFAVETPGLTLEGGMSEEGPVMGGAIIRRYRYRALLKAQDEPGDLGGDVRFATKDGSPAHHLPVLGSIQPPVSVRPSRLLATVIPGAEPLRLRLLMEADDPLFTLTAEPISATPDGLTIRRLPMEATGKVAFEVETGEDHEDGQLDAILRFETNHPDAPQVEVPISLRFPASSA